MRRTAVINQKGGVGKTTTAVNLGAALARRGRKVLMLDLDPQANLTLHLDRRPEPEQQTMAHLFLDDAPLADLIQRTSTPQLDLIPTDTDLSGVEQMLANRIGREMILREAFEALAAGGADYDVVLMDCPPSLGVLSANALVAAQDVLIPLQTEYFALQGMAKLMEIVTLVGKRLNPDLVISSILPCMVDLRTNLTEEVLAEIGRHFADRVARTMIRSNVKLAEAPSFGRTIFEHAPESNGALDYEMFAAEFLGELPADAVQFEWLQDSDDDEVEEEDEDAAAAPEANASPDDETDDESEDADTDESEDADTDEREVDAEPLTEPETLTAAPTVDERPANEPIVATSDIETPSPVAPAPRDEAPLPPDLPAPIVTALRRFSLPELPAPAEIGTDDPVSHPGTGSAAPI